ncbi:hypothetical protein [Natrialba swarupiae]|uniref:DUF8164 domain-containing protein n=1 Tax=Natrialba swarupiae TaxID=2448032 RepID=A0A5D5AS00_9EURY|nr:hypothetical protein [Natrialba swarupiae]TYT63777.1 hypothetical protein FYC77_00705 [Natrialba swarupiae]
MADSSPPRSDAATGFPIAPLLERSRIESGGHLEIGVSVSGTAAIEENELDVLLRDDRLAPGEAIDLGIFVSGTGTVRENELSVFYDGTDLIDLDDPGVVRRSLAASSSGSNDATADGGDGGSWPRSVTDARRDHAASLEWKPLGGNGRDEPVYLLEINTRTNAPPGRYAIPVVCTYRSESGIRQVERVPTIRVVGWRERWGSWIARGAIGLVLVVAVAVLFVHLSPV